jgi:hypothetical protein
MIDNLRDFLENLEKRNKLPIVEGADWDLESARSMSLWQNGSGLHCSLIISRVMRRDFVFPQI